jgi:hypothetical protein
MESKDTGKTMCVLRDVRPNSNVVVLSSSEERYIRNEVLHVMQIINVSSIITAQEQWIRHDVLLNSNVSGTMYY